MQGGGRVDICFCPKTVLVEFVSALLAFTYQIKNHLN